MTRLQHQRALAAAVDAARAAGGVLRRNIRSTKVVFAATRHDIKLELDCRCQALIEARLARAIPGAAFLGEEGRTGSAEAPARWVIDPIDGTVNFTHGIPHAGVSIALEERLPARPGAAPAASDYSAVAGVVYDPFTDELWTAIRGDAARLNGRPIHVSTRRRLGETIVSLGFGKRTEVLDHMLPAFHTLIHRVRKLRINGSAALALVYVATGRFDAFLERGLRLWDIAAGGLILECAGGDFRHEPLSGDLEYDVVASNGLIRRALRKHWPSIP
ncbi:MAG TPA: inositol monophosphatase family protein [Verrucomicrobiota bacterium]|nr:inositol monophosphatase family protein [Verrucomicrobiota bacterium]HNU51027.1 inositol monophosphatase family protein [Verrucomicrobiota bacterium]